MIKNLVFDFGGVIADIDKNKAIRAFKKLGMENIEDYIGLYAQKGIFLEVEDGQISDVSFCEKLSDVVGRKLSYEEVKQAWLGFFVGIEEYRLDYIEKLRSQYNLYILSNTNPFVQSWAQSTEFSSKGRSLRDYFDEIYTSYEIGYIKPAPEIFKYMIKDANLVPEETLFIDDGASNIKIAKELGFQTYLVAEGEDWRDNITQLLGTI